MMLILLVEDEPDLRDSLGAFLRAAGHAVVTAANGREAHNWLLHSGTRPDVILLDLIMPIMDGWHFRWQQVQDARLAQIPVVILSGEADVHEAASSLGAAGYFAKPFDPVRLLGALQNAYPREPMA